MAEGEKQRLPPQIPEGAAGAGRRRFGLEEKKSAEQGDENGEPPVRGCCRSHAEYGAEGCTYGVGALAGAGYRPEKGEPERKDAGSQGGPSAQKGGSVYEPHLFRQEQ